MLQTVEAIIDREGRIRLLEKVSITQARRALVTILEEVEKESADSSSTQESSAPVVGSIEVLTDDLEISGEEISRIFGEALSRSGESSSG